MINYSNNNRINFLETTSNKIFQSSINLGMNNDSDNDLSKHNYQSNNLINLINPTIGPFNIKVSFIYGDTPNIIISVVQNDEGGVIYDANKSLMINNESISLDDLVANMKDGFWLVCSFSQEYVPPSEKYSSKRLTGSWQISNIRIQGQE